MPPEFKRLQHLALKVRNIQKSLKFYCDVLGFKTTESYRFDKETVIKIQLILLPAQTNIM